MSKVQPVLGKKKNRIKKQKNPGSAKNDQKEKNNVEVISW